MITLDLVREHLRIDGVDEDTYLTFLMGAATAYVTTITLVANDSLAPEAYDTACLLLIGHLYQNREATSETNIVKVPYSFDTFLAVIRPVEGLI